MIIDLSVRLKKKIREKSVIAVTRSCRFHTTSKLSEAGNLANLIYFFHLVLPAYPTVFKTAWRGICCSSVLKSSACKFFDEKMNQIVNLFVSKL